MYPSCRTKVTAGKEERSLIVLIHKKMLFISIFIISLLTLYSFSLFYSSQAIQLNSVQIKSGGDCGNLLTYKGIVVKAYYAYYEANGATYPAYCLDKTKQGVTDQISYDVSVQEAIHDVRLWRYVVNGYPYKTVEQLGCQTKEEAFTATKQAIYCYVHGNQVNDYAPIGEAGQRTLNALKQIVSQANQSQETQIDNTIRIERVQEGFRPDSIDSQYLSQTYEVKANGQTTSYQVLLTKQEKSLEGIKVTSLTNETKQEFSSGEKFKVLLPINQLNQAGKFELQVQTSLQTKPVFYAKPSTGNYQDYALTAATYEETREGILEEYPENQTTIQLIKQDKESNQRMEGIVFDCYNEQKEKLYANLVTDQEGEIHLNHLLPGIYYFKEVKTKDGYQISEQWIKLEIKFNESVTITVTNQKEDKPEIVVNEKQLKTDLEKLPLIKKLPVTGN